MIHVFEQREMLMRVNGAQIMSFAVIFLASVCSADAVRGQAFQNLDFEASFVETSATSIFARVPGWTFSGEETFSHPFGRDALFFGIHIGFEPLQRMASDLVDANAPPPIQGHFSVLMGPSQLHDATGLYPWMEQTGQVPAGAKSIRLLGDLDPFFLRRTDPSRVGWHLTLNGAEIPLIDLPGGLVSGDVTAFAGTTATLRIATDASYYREVFMGSRLRTNFLFDAIRFSPLHYTVVPEPGSGVLATIIILSACGLRFRRRLIQMHSAR